MEEPVNDDGTAAPEYICLFCERGQCSRCRDRNCQCCFGSED